MNHFVLPRGQLTPIIPFAKTNGTQLAMSVREFTLLLPTIILCKYTKVMWLYKSKGFHNYFLRVKDQVTCFQKKINIRNQSLMIARCHY